MKEFLKYGTESSDKEDHSSIKQFFLATINQENIKEEDLLKFYQSKEYACFLLHKYSHDMMVTDPFLADFLKGRGDIHTMLDYGFQDGFAALLANETNPKIKVKVAILDNMLADMLENYSKEHSNLQVIKITGKHDEKFLRANAKFDLISCVFVLERVIHPISIVESLASHIRKGKYLFLSTFFDDMQGHEPMHLKMHNKYQNFNLWLSELKRIGLQPIWRDENKVYKVWQKLER